MTAVTPLADRFIVGLTEAGEMLGVTKQRVNQLRHSPDFPKPLEELACGPIWLKAAVEDYSAWRRRRSPTCSQPKEAIEP